MVSSSACGYFFEICILKHVGLILACLNCLTMILQANEIVRQMQLTKVGKVGRKEGGKKEGRRKGRKEGGEGGR